MGHAASRELLLARWAQIVEDASLSDLPGKLELSEQGAIEMSPATNRHGMHQADLAWLLRTSFVQGRVITGCSILTSRGIRVPDVAWASDQFLAGQEGNDPFTNAPELCIEVRSASNPESELLRKMQAYLAAGALEAWIVSEDGRVRIFSSDGERQDSRFGIRYQAV